MTKTHQIDISASKIASLVEESVGSLSQTLRPDYLAALEASLASETNARAREVLGQLLENARIAQSEKLPLCQDTGYVWVCLEVTDPSVVVPGDVFSKVDAAVARAAEESGMRMSVLQDALIKRVNTTTNTPAFCEVVFKNREHTSSTDALATLHIMLKGGGSDNASAVAMLPPSAGIEGVVDFVQNAVLAKGANCCPPLVIGVGVGSTFDKVAGLAKHALLREVGSTHANPEIAELEKTVLAKLNSLDIGPGGLGGDTTALAVHIESSPCHIAALPVAINIGCTALRSVSIPLI